MTAEELIRLLKKYPKSMDVVLANKFGFSEVEGLAEVPVFKIKHSKILYMNYPWQCDCDKTVLEIY